MNVIYYFSNYYLLPDKFRNADEFAGSVKKWDKLRLERLVEDGCIAPFFIQGKTKTEDVVFEEPSQIFPVEAEILPKSEYQTRLAALSEDYCKGCPKYKGLPSDEMSLDGMCYEDEDDLRDQLRDRASAFWDDFAENEPRLRELIDLGKFGDVKTDLEGKLSFLGSVYAAVNRIAGRYKLMLSGLFDQELSLLCAYLVSRAPESIKENWDVFPYLPQNVFKYRPTEEKAKVFENAPLVRFTRKDADRPRFDLTLKIKADSDDDTDAFVENMLYVFSVMGENRFFASLSSISCDGDYDNGRDGFVHIKDYSAEVQKCYQEKLRTYFRRFNYVELRAAAENCRGMRKENQLVTTNCDALTRIMLTDTPEKLAGMKTDIGTVGTITFDFGKSIMYYQDKLRPIHDQIEKALCEPGFAIPFAACYGPTKVYVDFILADVNRARKAIRALTPMLSAYSAIYTETSCEGSNSYVCCYELGTKEA